MKNLIIIFSFVVALFFNVDAMQSEILNNASEKLSVVRYEIRKNSQFEAIQAPSESKVYVRGVFGPGVMIAKSININGIVLQYDMAPNDFKMALSRLWRVNANSISYREDSMSKEFFSSMMR